MNKPLILDLFCCAGGASRGYGRAGFRIVGVDNKPQPHYPYPFVQADALGLLDHLIEGWHIHVPEAGIVDLNDIAGFHASPPCQRFAALVHCRPGVAETYPDLINPVRERLAFTGKPYVIENVMGAPMNPTAVLCGTQFGKRFQLHRQFEANFPIEQLECHHELKPFNIESTAGRQRMLEEFGDQGWARFWREKDVADIPGRKARREAISPYYTEWVGSDMLWAIEAAKHEEAA